MSWRRNGRRTGSAGVTVASVASEASPRIGYEVANALGRLNADRPKLGAVCVNEVVKARAVRYMLHALDLYQQQSGRTPEQINRDVATGRIELRLDGHHAVVVTP